MLAFPIPIPSFPLLSAQLNSLEVAFVSRKADVKVYKLLQVGLYVCVMMSSNSKSNLSQTIVLVVALVLLFISIALCIAGLLSPSWQVVDIREFRAVHHVSIFFFLRFPCSFVSTTRRMQKALFDEKVLLEHARLL